ncbi:MAG TPA: EVE domain-containing protein [Pyrinomonadaceae bacterium]|jgi:predicted RNA-binding protein
MTNRKYWLALFTGTTWQEFLDAGASIYGVNHRYKSMASRTKPGDYLICYVAGISRFIGLLEIVSPSYWDTTSIWTFDIYPVRLKVRVVLNLLPETAVPVKELITGLSSFRNMKHSSSWAMFFRQPFREWQTSDAETIVKVLKKAKQHPILRSVLASQLAKEPQ